jgi:hypothetical protein
MPAPSTLPPRRTAPRVARKVASSLVPCSLVAGALHVAACASNRTSTTNASPSASHLPTFAASAPGVAAAASPGGAPTPDGAPSPNGAPASSGAPTPTAPPRTLRDVDWRNRSYLPGIIELHDGRAELREYNEDGLHDTDIFKLDGVLYGDLDGDGAEDALVVINGLHYPAHSYATPRQSGRAFLFTLHEGSAHSLTSIDQCCSPIERATIAGSALEFSRNEGYRSCAVRYRWKNGALREEEAAKRCSPASAPSASRGPDRRK